MLTTDEQTPRPVSTFQSRRKGPPAALRIHAPVQNSPIALMFDDANSTASASSSAASSATSDSDSLLPFARPDKPRSMRNTKRLSLVLPSALDNRSSNSLPLVSEPDITPSDDTSQPSSSSEFLRRPSVISLPPSRGATRLHRKDEDDFPTIPYLDGPVQILPGVWLGSEDNARDWDRLGEKGIRSILNVAREVNSPFDANASTQVLRPFVSEPDLKEMSRESQSTFHSAHGPSGRPAMHYLKLPWSHGQKNLVHEGFVDAMAFVDAALERGDGVLVQCVFDLPQCDNSLTCYFSCQCGVSRSATVVIALVMRAAALELPSVSPEVWSLKSGGMHAAYAYVKEKSKWAGPNMS